MAESSGSSVGSPSATSEMSPPASGFLTLRLEGYHAQEETRATSEVVRIGPVQWVATLTIFKDTYMKSNGRPTSWYNYLVQITSILPEDTKYYSCHATINHGWFTDVRLHGTAPRRLPEEPTFHETFKYQFTHLAPRFRHRFTFDRGLAYDETESKMVVFLKVNLEHEMPPVRPASCEFGTNASPWQDLKVICGPEQTEIFTNKSILALVSPVFRALLYGEFRERDADSIVLPDTSFEDFLELLQHIYPNVRKPINESNVGILLRLADRYLMDSVTEECEKYLIFYDATRSSHNGGVLTLQERTEFANEYRLKVLKLECDREFARLMQNSCSMK